MYFTTNQKSDCLKLQQGLDRFSTWCLDNGLHLNKSKCMRIDISPQTLKKHFTNYYNLTGSKTNVVNKVRGLGIILPSDLSIKQHKETIFAKAFRISGFMKRNCADIRI